MTSLYLVPLFFFSSLLTRWRCFWHPFFSLSHLYRAFILFIIIIIYFPVQKRICCCFILPFIIIHSLCKPTPDLFRYGDVLIWCFFFCVFFFFLLKSANCCQRTRVWQSLLIQIFVLKLCLLVLHTTFPAQFDLFCTRQIFFRVFFFFKTDGPNCCPFHFHVNSSIKGIRVIYFRDLLSFFFCPPIPFILFFRMIWFFLATFDWISIGRCWTVARMPRPSLLFRSTWPAIEKIITNTKAQPNRRIKKRRGTKWNETNQKKVKWKGNDDDNISH